MDNAGKMMRVCTLCNELSPYDSRYCIGCGRYLPVEGPTIRLPMEGPTQPLRIESDNPSTEISAQSNLSASEQLSLSYISCWPHATLGASGLYWNEFYIWDIDPSGNISPRLCKFGVRIPSSNELE